MSDPDRQQQLQQLEARIKAAKGRNAPKPRADEPLSQAHMAWRMVIELVAGLGIGFGIGYGLDRLFGTLPLFMLIFTMLGLAAGIKTMLRSVREMENKDAAAAAKTPQGAKEQSAPQGDADEGA